MTWQQKTNPTRTPAGGADVGAKLFGTWEIDEIAYEDPSTERYISVTPVAHTAGRHASKQFQKSQISIVERFINRLMQSENTGKKQQNLNFVREAFELIHERTEENPCRCSLPPSRTPRRSRTVRLKYGGISVPKAVDVAPQRRVDQALKFLAEGVHNDSFKTQTSVPRPLHASLLARPTTTSRRTRSVRRRKSASRRPLTDSTPSSFLDVTDHRVRTLRSRADRSFDRSRHARPTWCRSLEDDKTLPLTGMDEVCLSASSALVDRSTEPWVWSSEWRSFWSSSPYRRRCCSLWRW
ncbi:hypothetical protein D8S78_18815 [Natrialba swarupiae]|nr:hypothetical protein [Natrialba swarupiae]